MATQPPQDPRRMTWFDDQSRYWVRGDRRRTGGAAGGVTFAPLE